MSAYSQKGKLIKVAAKKAVVAQADNLTAELLEKKSYFKLYMLSGKDSMQLQTMPLKLGTGLPTDVKIIPFTAKGTKLYSVSWNEKNTIGDAKTKLENIAETHTQIWDVSNKTMLYDNVQTVDNISEVVWLDPNKTASKTVEKIKRDGFELTITPQGDLILKNKTQQDKMTYDAAQKKFVAVKK